MINLISPTIKTNQITNQIKLSLLYKRNIQISFYIKGNNNKWMQLYFSWRHFLLELKKYPKKNHCCFLKEHIF